MTSVFADAGYWIAVLNPNDALHSKATQASATLARTRVITTELVLSEVLNAFARKGELARMGACALIDKMRSNPNVEIVPMTSNAFRQALERYRRRADKTWGLTDCASFLIMEEGNHGSAQRRSRFSAGRTQSAIARLNYRAT
jgi:predicted nucleic acid-binding protein